MAGNGIVALTQGVATQVSALTDDKALLIVNCEAVAGNTIDPPGSFTQKRSSRAPYVCGRRFNRGVESNDMELMNAFLTRKRASW